MGNKANRKIKNATSNVQNGIHFRSKLEAYAYKQLEEAGIDSKYEEVKYVLQEGFHYEEPCYENTKSRGFIDNTYKVRAITYTPDFVDPNGKWILEIKGWSNDVFPLKWKMFKRYLIDNDLPPVLLLPKNQKQVREAIKIIKTL
tara:strand:- start:6894 stop:7325 length:432 start_codon:yes stop_codon:yes gene_type:complete